MSDSQLIENSEDWWDLLRDDIKILGVHRQSRIRPKTDYKYILSLNCLACWKLIESKSLVPGLFEDWDFSKHIAWVEQTFKIYDSSTNRVYSKGSGYGIAELTDYAYFCRALIAAHQYSQNVDYLKNAKTILDRILNDFTDEKDFYFNESKKDDQLSPGKTKQLFDQTMPSGNAVVCECLLILGKLLGLEGLVEKGEKMILGLKDSMVKFPLAFPYWVNVYQNHICNPIDIVIIGKQSKEVFDSLKGTHYLPNALYVSMDFENELIPLTIGKSKDSETYIYYCEGMSCSPPFKTVKDLNKWLR